MTIEATIFNIRTNNTSEANNDYINNDLLNLNIIYYTLLPHTY